MLSLFQEGAFLFSWEFIILLCILLMAHTSETVTGFGSTIISVALGANFFPLDVLIPVIVPLNFLLCLYIVTVHRGHIDGKTLGLRIIPFMAIGMPLGLFIFNIGELELLQVGFGFFVICITVFELYKFFNQGGVVEAKPLTTIKAAPWLLVGGIIHGIYASGGPLVVYYASKEFSHKKVFRSTLSSLWLIMTIVLMTNYFVTGKLNAETLQVSAFMLPTLVLGIVLGEIIHERIDERIFRMVVYILLLFAGASLILG